MSISILAAACLLATGCQKVKHPPRSYDVQINDTVEMNDMYIASVTITAMGQRRLHLQLPDGDEDMAEFGTADSAQLSSLQLVFIAEQVEFDGSAASRLKWSVHTDHSSMEGGTGFQSSTSGSRLEDFFSFNLSEGNHAFGEIIEWAELDGKTYSIFVD